MDGTVLGALIVSGGITPASVVIMMVKGWLVPGWLAKQREAALTAAYTENNILTHKMIDTAIPAVTHSALVLESITPLIAEIARNRTPPNA